MAAKKPAGGGSQSGAAAAAEAEVVETVTHHQITFRGLDLLLPAVLPGSLLFDFGDMDGGDHQVGAAMRMLESLLGRDQFLMVRRKVVEDQIPMTEVEGVITELMSEIFSLYGLELGESPASPAS